MSSKKMEINNIHNSTVCIFSANIFLAIRNQGGSLHAFNGSNKKELAAV